MSATCLWYEVLTYTIVLYLLSLNATSSSTHLTPLPRSPWREESSQDGCKSYFATRSTVDGDSDGDSEASSRKLVSVYPFVVAPIIPSVENASHMPPTKQRFDLLRWESSFWFQWRQTDIGSEPNFDSSTFLFKYLVGVITGI